ncbi:hypothetical protein BaRGS_00030835, partial [Batillaria attramentaria]
TGEKRPCTSSDCVIQAGALLQAMDMSADPCQDFYQFACGGWMQTHSVPEDSASYDRFTELRDLVMLELKGLLETPYDSTKESDTIRKAKALYQSCQDEEALRKLGAKPMMKMVRTLGHWPLLEDNASIGNDSVMLQTLLEMAKLDEFPLFDVTVSRDLQNSSRYIAWGRNSTKVLVYEQVMRDIAEKVLGAPPGEALASQVRAAVDFNAELANISASRTERRDTDRFYHKMTTAELQQLIPQFPFQSFLVDYCAAAGVSMTNDTEIAVFAVDYLKSMAELVHNTNKSVVANYLLLRFSRAYLGFLAKEYRDLNQPLREAEEMIHYIRGSMEQMIRDVSWMDESTKDAALEKADAMIEKIGYPYYQNNETALQELYKDIDYQNDTYFDNAMAYYKTAIEENVKLLNKQPDRKAEEHQAASSGLDICFSGNVTAIEIACTLYPFPAGILQPPFYAEHFPTSMMFGGIGMVIGHEMTHGFDDQGRKYDKEGNSRSWWSNSSVTEFQKLAQCYVTQYNGFTEFGMHVNGQMTLGENIADNGGIKAAYMAFDKWQSHNEVEPLLPGLNLTHPQLFFVNFAQGWCHLAKPAGAQNAIRTDVHSPADVRVIASVSNSDYFAKAYNCPKASRMNPDNKCYLW